MNGVDIPMIQQLIKNEKILVDYRIIFNHCYLTKTGKKFVTVYNATHYAGMVRVK